MRLLLGDGNMATYDIALSSGGTKGLAFTGALEALDRAGHSVGRTIGSSAGAIPAVLLAAGLSGRELAQIASERGTAPFRVFMSLPSAKEARAALAKPDSETRRVLKASMERAVDHVLRRLGQKYTRIEFFLRAALATEKDRLSEAALEGLIGDGPDDGDPVIALVSFLEFGGLFSSDAFVTWLSEQISTKVEGFRPDWSFRRFHEQTGGEPTVVVSDTTARQALFLNRHTAPDCPVTEAARMSMSIPMVWREIAWQAGWGKYLGTPRTGHWMVDGAATRNMPVQLFVDANQPEVQRLIGPPSGNEPLGLLLDDTLPPAGHLQPLERESKLVTRVGRLIDTVTQWEEETYAGYEKHICRIPTLGFGTLEFDAPDERIEILINSGRCAMGEFLKRK